MDGEVFYFLPWREHPARPRSATLCMRTAWGRCRTDGNFELVVLVATLSEAVKTSAAWFRLLARVGTCFLTCAGVWIVFLVSLSYVTTLRDFWRVQQTPRILA